MDISVGSGGGAGSSGPLQFIKNSSTVSVTQDTTTPANNIPLPVQLYGTSGTINITAGDINVQLSDQGANPDVTRIGDGTTQLGITVSNEAKVADSTARVSLASIDTKTPALGQALAASSVPVVLTAAQLTTLTPLSSVTVTQATAANLNATVVGTGTFATQVTSLPSLPAGANTIGAISNTSFAATQATAANLNATVVQGAAGASAWKVDGSAVTQPVSAASLPLPSGAATETTLNAMLVENSDFTASGSITTQNLVPAGSATAGSAVAISVAGKGTVTVQVTGTYTGALSPQVTTDGTNWITQTGAVLQNMATNASAATIPSASVGIWQIEVNGHAQFRITALAAVTGTATITLRAADGTSQVSVAGVATSALQTTGNTSLSSIDTKTPALGQAVMASSTPVVISSNQSSIPVTQGGKSKVNIVRNDYSSTNVTSAAYVQLIASTSAASNMLEVFDSSGQTLVLAVGGAGSEVDQFYINPGGNGQVPLLIPASSRVSIKAVTATASAGYINLNLYS